MEVINAFETSTGVKLNYKIGPQREGDVTAVYANADKANRILNWKAEIDINQALKDSWNWEKSLQENE